jgi:hypothetical protein
MGTRMGTKSRIVIRSIQKSYSRKKGREDKYKHKRKISGMAEGKTNHLGRQLGLADGPGAKGEGHLGDATLGDGSLEEELECDLEAGGVNWR